MPDIVKRDLYPFFFSGVVCIGDFGLLDAVALGIYLDARGVQGHQAQQFAVAVDHLESIGVAAQHIMAQHHLPELGGGLPGVGAGAVEQGIQGVGGVRFPGIAVALIYFKRQTGDGLRYHPHAGKHGRSGQGRGGRDVDAGRCAHNTEALQDPVVGVVDVQAALFGLFGKKIDNAAHNILSYGNNMLKK